MSVDDRQGLSVIVYPSWLRTLLACYLCVDLINSTTFHSWAGSGLGNELYGHLGDKPHVKTIGCIAVAPELCLDYHLPAFPFSSPMP